MEHLAANPNKLFWLIAAIALGVPAVLCIGLAASGNPTPFTLPVALATSLLSFGAIPLFLTGLKGFTKELRRACQLLYLGVILYGIGQLQFPLFTIINAPFWTNSGLVTLPYFFAIGFIFFGMRRFGKLMGLRLIWMSRVVMLLIAIAGAALVIVLLKSERAGLMAFEVLLSVFLLAAAMIAVSTRRIVATRYHAFLAFLTASISMLVITALHDIATTLWLPEDNWYAQNLSTTPALLAAFLFLTAGYTFCRIQIEGKSTGNATPIDVISYVANLASNPSEIDLQLDKLRQITSQLTPGEPLTKAQEAELAETYKGIETYLVEKESLRRFSRDELRERIRIHFQFDTKANSPLQKIIKD